MNALSAMVPFFTVPFLMKPIDAQRFFSATYDEARALLKATAKEVGMEMTSYVHPLVGPNDEPLSTDVVRIGKVDAANLVVLISGTHGVETLCGSACQTAFLAEKQWQDLASGYSGAHHSRAESLGRGSPATEQ